MPSVHDNEILSYLVDLKNHKITFQSNKYGDSTKIVELVFREVLAYFFETQLEGSIILDIEKYDLSHFMKHNKDLLEKQKNYGWPLDYHSEEELIEILTLENYQYYVILSSYGLSGWVLCKAYEVISDEENK